MDASDRRRRASREAATWFVRLQIEELQRADREEFVDWLRESAVHVAEMLRVAKVHGSLEQFQSWLQVAVSDNGDDADHGPDDQDDHDNVVAFPPHPDSASSPVSLPARDEAAVRTRRRVWLGAMAAGLAGLAILGVLFSPLLRTQTIQTERGERREVALADGSVVDVDPETRIRVAFEEHTRRLFLERGRALFRVAKNPERPFLVQADGTTVRAVGTAFGVEHRKQGVIVTVAEGKVGVYVKEMSTHRSQLPSQSDAEGSSPSIPLQHLEKEGPAQKAGEASPSPRERRGEQGVRVPEPSTLFLTANQQVTVQPSGTAAPVRKVNSDRELAWAKGQLVFDDESVADAVEEFNRYNRVQLHVTDEALAMRPVSGVFDASDPESFIQFLQTVTSARVMRGESEIIMQ